MRPLKRQPVLLFSTVIAAFFLLAGLVIIPAAAGAGRLTYVSDTISTSAPGASASHSYNFTLQHAIPASGRVTITPESGQFTIPAQLDFNDVSVSVNGSGVPVGPSATATDMGVTVTAGSSGSINLTQNSSSTLPAGDVVIVQVGRAHQISNPGSAGSYPTDITTATNGGSLVDEGQARIAIVDSIHVSASNGSGNGNGGGGGGGGGPGSQTDLTIDPSIGGVIVHTNIDGSTLTLQFPKGFWTNPTVFRITDLTSGMAQSLAPFPPGKILAGSSVQSILGVDQANVTVLLLARPVTMIYHYTDDIASRINIASLKVYTLTDPARGWQEVPDAQIQSALVNPNNKTVAVSVNHFSLFALLGDPNPGQPPSSGTVEECSNRRIGDLNCDGKVDLVDFSILLYNWGVPKNPLADLNDDGQVDLVDFSILLYWWTG